MGIRASELSRRLLSGPPKKPSKPNINLSAGGKNVGTLPVGNGIGAVAAAEVDKGAITRRLKRNKSV
jgi:hypothetical protein